MYIGVKSIKIRENKQREAHSVVQHFQQNSEFIDLQNID